MDDLGARIRERVETRGEETVLPERVYGFYHDRIPAPALYVEAEETPADVTPIIVHNFRYYEDAMRRWNTGVVEVLVLNELHELTHWAMTEDERAALQRRSVERGVPDGRIINPVLFRLIDWLGGEYTEVHDPGPPRWRRVLDGAVRYLRGLFGDGGRNVDGEGDDF